MAATKYRGTEHTASFVLGYYVFQLPNGETWDMFEGILHDLPADLSKLPAKYVERTVTGPELAARFVFPPRRIETTDQLEQTLRDADALGRELKALAECAHLVTDNFGRCENCFESM